MTDRILQHLLEKQEVWKYQAESAEHKQSDGAIDQSELINSTKWKELLKAASLEGKWHLIEEAACSSS